MTEYTNDYDRVINLGPSPLSDRFTRVRGGVWTKLGLDIQDYVVFTDTMRYRMDDQPHPLDVRELKVLSTDSMAGEDGSASVVLEVKG
ncbi:hypothetical protein G6K88_14155 [Agrobacterium rhizogenes]|uniref:hypothetical protein n=1 Tax=Rhizobium rhizogenes TaxID=359 RepID=UPI00115ECF87|nr:hypothetical protein [Rhizobium rhizogenes]NTI03163.1 hypothetical protein [Rhizobium rhizogenes]NTI09967.1 hypothetical protein [Rhizobium rhizogenes]TRB21509.1 hypothetical protein EXN70_21620 [Rhizobium rhizogenes]